MHGREVRSAEEMSQMAPFTDGGRTIDRTNWTSTYISYYPFGGAIALGLDLSLRGRSDGHITLDDFMRAMWQAHGKPGGAREGYVDHPYTLQDAEQRLGDASRDPAFAHDFFARYIHGHEMLDYARLLQPAGLVMKKTNAGRAWWGELQLDQRNGLRVAASPLANTPVYKAGLDLGDEIREIDRTRVRAEDALAILRRHRPGDTLTIDFVDRSGKSRSSTVLLGEDPRVDVVPVESTGGSVTAAQRAFRQAWLGPR
jgi:predicted metalloprotease with PDZ domain